MYWTPRIGFELENLKQLITTLDARDHIPQLELAMGEALDDVPDGKAVAVIVRHMVELGDSDLQKLQAFFAERNWQLYLQPKGSDTVHRIDADNARPNGLTGYHRQTLVLSST